MRVGIIGYGSMGSMLVEKFAASGLPEGVFVSTRTQAKLEHVPDGVRACRSNGELAACADIVFLCVRPADLRPVLEEILPSLRDDALLVSLNGSVSFALLERIADRKIAKVIPSVTAEIDRSQTLMCCNGRVQDSDKCRLKALLACFGEVIELPENEIGMGAEMVSCMPGFLAAASAVLCRAAGKHTSLPEGQLARMLLNTMAATAELMLQRGLSCEEVVARVATRGGITEDGVKVIDELLPAVADRLFEKTLEKRRLTAQRAEAAFTGEQQGG